ncbi:MAG: hypothetical protein K0S80_4799, partial [Neobacillus sp.]|nr:hypothetical protein [Neobacillus sp.]
MAAPKSKARKSIPLSEKKVKRKNCALP